MPKPSKIEPVLIRPEEWLKTTSPPMGSQEGHHFGVNCVVNFVFPSDAAVSARTPAVTIQRKRTNKSDDANDQR